MEGSEPVTEFQQMLIVDGEQRAFQRSEHRQLVVGPLDGGERRAHRLDFFAAVERLAADEQVRNAARFDRVDVRPRHVVAEADESPEENRDVLRLNRPSLDRPAVLRVHEPLDERSDRIGQRIFDRLR